MTNPLRVDRPADTADDEQSTARAVEVAEALLRVADSGTSWRERRRADRLGPLLADPDGRELLFALTDEVLRTPSPARSMAQLRRIVDAGLPAALPAADRVA
ncbi:MAG: hypothetical protein H0W46_13075, partial [Acidimicrobiia bacterium]|nr:hypothetical protein [Acidimicrobiia bacterium]